jgi:hypothetical protein
VSKEQALKDVADIINADPDGFWLLAGDLTDERRKEALQNFLVNAYGKGYQRGLIRGTELLHDRLAAPLPKEMP